MLVNLANYYILFIMKALENCKVTLSSNQGDKHVSILMKLVSKKVLKHFKWIASISLSPTFYCPTPDNY